MEARRRARGRRERVRLAEGEAKGHGPTFFAEQRGLVTDGEDVHERRSGRRWQVDLPSGCRFVPSSENQGSQIRWIGGLPPRRWFKRLSVSVRTVRWRVRIHDHPSYQQEDWAIVNSNRIGSNVPSISSSSAVSEKRMAISAPPRHWRGSRDRPSARTFVGADAPTTFSFGPHARRRMLVRPGRCSASDISPRGRDHEAGPRRRRR